MKFISWNVNGLRACIQKGFLDEFNRLDADFFCLQETKLSAGQLQLNMPGYEQYWCYAEKKGYSGTAIFTKHHPLSVSYGIGVPELDNEGRVITLEYKEFYLVTCYTPNAQRGLARIDHRMTWDEAFRNYLQKLDEVKPVIICGDLNVAHKEIDLKNPASNRGNAGFSDEERESFQKTLDLGFTDSFRHLYPDITGRYSWWSYMFKARENNAGWRIDYFLVSNRLSGAIQKADIYSDILGSDHCPVMLELDTLVNGAIWSPTAGIATVVETEAPKKKATKASPVNGKALALFCLLLSFVITLACLPTVFSHTDPDPTDPTASVDAPFAVHILSQRFARVPDSPVLSGKYINAFLSFVEYHTDRLTDDDGTYYVESFDEASLATSNFWLRLELTDYGKENYRSDIVPRISSFSDMLSSTITSSHLIYQYAIPYYADVEHTIIRGWLVWGLLEESDSLMIWLDNFEYACTVDLEVIPLIGEDLIAPDDPIVDLPVAPAEYLTVQAYYTPPQIIYVSTSPLSSTLFPALQTSDNEIWHTGPSFESQLQDQLANADFWLRISLTDEALQHLAGESYTLSYSPFVDMGREPSNILIPYYADTTLTQVAGWFLFGDDATISLATLGLSWYSNHYLYQGDLPITHYIRTEDAATMETFALVEHILTNPGICDELGMAVPDYSGLCVKYPALAELDLREDAVDALMNFPAEQYDLPYNCRYVISYLLSTESYRAKMTPDQETLYILNRYPACPYAMDNLLVQSTMILSDCSTETLIANMLLKSNMWDTYFAQCSSYETREYMYRFIRVFNPIAMELEKRDDTEQYLLEMIPSDGDVNLASYLLELWPVMQELNGKPTDVQ